MPLISVPQVSLPPIVHLGPWPGVEGTKLRANMSMYHGILALESALRLGKLRIGEHRLAFLALVKHRGNRPE